jgi:DNA polymerase-3 subunit delta
MSLQLLKSIDKIPLAPIISLIGPEYFIRKKIRESITERALAGGLRDMNYSHYRAGEAETGNIFQACRDYPCFAAKRVVWINDVSRWKGKEGGMLIEYLQNPPDTTLLILEDDKLDGRLDWVKKLKNKSHYIEVPMVSTEEAIKWVLHCLKKEGKKGSIECVHQIIDWTGLLLEPLQLAVMQLSLYVGEGEEITVRDLESLLLKITEEDVFKVIDAVFEKDNRRLPIKLKELLDSGEAPLKILALLHRHLMISLALAEDSSQEVGQGFKVGGWVLRRYQEQRRKISKGFSKSLLKPLAEADLQIKGSGLPAPLILRHCLEKISESLAQGLDQFGET